MPHWHISHIGILTHYLLMKKKSANKEILAIIKAARKQSREEEIRMHGKPILRTKVKQSKKQYKRNKRVEDLD